MQNTPELNSSSSDKDEEEVSPLSSGVKNFSHRKSIASEVFNDLDTDSEEEVHKAEDNCKWIPIGQYPLPFTSSKGQLEHYNIYTECVSVLLVLTLIAVASTYLNQLGTIYEIQNQNSNKWVSKSLNIATN